ncbi:hypothetical protein SKAU_G00119740 [Synaphobranchus kaupii]|uniref:Uncharacterized protein n=1 Tax=Synaphobranchus kaupii TaxID=118154 RepID=A0A9Q1FP34_SYNKA|nr:hypothetical protein SKAU_G00119740 [Synaphobranchus kaupii]
MPPMPPPHLWDGGGLATPPDPCPCHFNLICPASTHHPRPAHNMGRECKFTLPAGRAPANERLVSPGAPRDTLRSHSAQGRGHTYLPSVPRGTRPYRGNKRASSVTGPACAFINFTYTVFHFNHAQI